MILSDNRNNSDEKDVPLLNVPDICTGGLSGAPRDVTDKYCREKKRGTCHIKIRPIVEEQSKR